MAPHRGLVRNYASTIPAHHPRLLIRVQSVPTRRSRDRSESRIGRHLRRTILGLGRSLDLLDREQRALSRQTAFPRF